MSQILITICARGGSKGIPNKNTKKLNGMPLLHYTLEIANKFALNHNAYIQLSTDSPEILKTASQFGYTTDYVRPEKLATDNAGKIDAIKDALEYSEKTNSKQYDYVLDLDVTSPLRTISDLENAFAQLKGNSKALNIFSVNKAARNPYFNMVEESQEGFVKVVKESRGFKSRQEVPLVYDMNASFYFFKRKFFEEGYKISTTPYSLAYVMDHLCFDLDHPHDFEIMEHMLKNNLLDFDL